MKKITKEIGQYTLARYISEFFLAIRGFIIARVLGPSSYGVWNMLKVFISFAEYGQLGSYNALTREIPYNSGKGHAQKNEHIKRVSFTYSFLLTLVIALAVCIASFHPYFHEYQGEVQLSSLVFLAASIHWFNQNVLKGENKIKELSWYMIGYALLNTILGLSLLFVLEIQGLLLGMTGTFLILFVYLLSTKNLEFSFSFDLKKYWKLVHIGYPILLLSLVYLLMQKIDSILVFVFLGSEMTGYYGLAAFITMIVHYIPLSLNTVLLPKMMHKIGKSNTMHIHNYLLKPHTFLVKGLPILLGLIIINIPWVIDIFLPEYQPAIMTLQVLTLGIFFSSLLALPNNILVAMNKQKSLVKKLVVVLVLVIILDIVAILLGYGILGVAIATSVSLAIAYIVSMNMAMVELKIEGTHARSALLHFVYLFLGTGIILMMANYVIQNVLFILLFLPLILSVLRKGRLLWQH